LLLPPGKLALGQLALRFRCLLFRQIYTSERLMFYIYNLKAQSFQSGFTLSHRLLCDKMSYAIAIVLRNKEGE